MHIYECDCYCLPEWMGWATGGARWVEEAKDRTEVVAAASAVVVENVNVARLAPFSTVLYQRRKHS